MEDLYKFYTHKYNKDPDYFFDEKAAKFFVYAIESNLVHPKGPLSGQPFLLADWQKRDIILPLFGVKKRSDNLRRYKFIYCEVPKKNGKSPLLAAIVLVVLKFIKDSGAELVSLASSRDQAKIVFGDAKKMLRKGSDFAKSYKPMQNAIMVDEKSYKPLSADVGTNDGGNNNFICIDELHRFKARDLVDLMEGSIAAKEDPIFFMITTAGKSLTSICYEKHEYAIAVRDGIIKDDRFLPVIYAAEPKDDPFIESTWIKANPNYGISVRKEFMAEQAEKAKRNASYLNTFKTLHLNIWTNQKESWVSDLVWTGNNKKFNSDEMHGHCCGGLDLSSVSDLTAFTYGWFEDEHYYSKTLFWLPEDKAKNSADKNNVYYNQWVKDGRIKETPGNVVDYRIVSKDILELCDKHNIQVVAFDPHNSTQVIVDLEEHGIKTFMHRQGTISMNKPVKEWERLLLMGNFVNNNCPVLRWMAGNVGIVSDNGGNRKFDRKRYEQKIDGLVSNAMCLSMLLDTKPDDDSYLSKSTEKQIHWLYLSDEEYFALYGVKKESTIEDAK